MANEVNPKITVIFSKFIIFLRLSPIPVNCLRLDLELLLSQVSRLNAHLLTIQKTLSVCLSMHLFQGLVFPDSG